MMANPKPTSPPPVMVPSSALREAELIAPVFQNHSADGKADAGRDQCKETRPEEDLFVLAGRGGRGNWRGTHVSAPWRECKLTRKAVTGRV